MTLLLIFSQAPPSLDGTIDLIQIGFVGIALIWFAMGKVYPDNTVKDLKEQIVAKDKIIEEERMDSKSVRDAVIKDVAPVMARLVDRDKEIVELLTRILAQGKQS